MSVACLSPGKLLVVNEYLNNHKGLCEQMRTRVFLVLTMADGVW